MQVPIPAVQNEPIHANMHKKYPPKQVKWALLHADTPIHSTHTSTYQDSARHSNEPIEPPGSYLERKEKYFSGQTNKFNEQDQFVLTTIPGFPCNKTVIKWSVQGL